MITEAIIVAIVTGVSSIIGNYLIFRKNTKEDSIKRAKREQLLDSKLESIEIKLDEHNHYAEKFGEIEKSIVSIKKDIEYLRKDK